MASDDHADVLKKFKELYLELFKHDGFGEMTVEMRILKRCQKEIIISCGRQFRFVVDWKNGQSKPEIYKNLARNAEGGSETQGINKSEKSAIRDNRKLSA